MSNIEQQQVQPSDREVELLRELIATYSERGFTYKTMSRYTGVSEVSLKNFAYGRSRRPNWDFVTLTYTLGLIFNSHRPTSQTQLLGRQHHRRDSHR